MLDPVLPRPESEHTSEPAEVVNTPVPTQRRAVDTRLSIPQLPPNLVSRTRLMSALDEAVSSPGLTLVTAGPGSGKTVLLSDWARRRDAPTAWLALMKAHNQKVPFWSLVVRAVWAAQQSSPAVSPYPWVGQSIPDIMDMLFSDGELDGAPSASPPAVLILDDAHVLTDPEILEGLDHIVRRWSHRIRLVLAARSTPMLAIHQYRLAGALHEVRSLQLAMTAGETQQLLLAHRVTLAPSEMLVLARRTEGWTAGLRLAALRMQGVENPSDFVAEMAMDGGSIGEYLVAEVLSVLPAHVRHILVLTSFLDEVTGDSAEAVTGVEGCEEILAELARTNSFVVPLDAARTRFRYHTLLREVLQYLARREPARSREETNRRATQWFRSRGNISSALRWATASGDTRQVAAVLAHGFAHAFVYDQAFGVAMGAISLRPASADLSGEELDELETARLVVLAHTAEPASARAEVDRARVARDASSGSPPTTPRLGGAIALNRELALFLICERAGLHEEAGRRLDQLLATDLAAAVPDVVGLRSKLSLARAKRSFWSGTATDIAQALATALAEAEREQATHVQVEVLAVQAMNSAYAGRLRTSWQCVDHADRLLRQHSDLVRPVTLDLGTAARAYCLADLETMADAMSRVVEAGPLYADPQLAAVVAHLQGILLSACGRYADARAWLESPVFDLAGASSTVRVLRDCELAAIEIVLGRPRRAAARLEPYQHTPFAVASGTTLARARLALGDVGGAKHLVRSVRTAPRSQVNRWALVKAMLCEAEIALAEDDEAGAMNHLERARDLADGDIVMPFVQMTPVFAAMLGRHPPMVGGWPDPAPLPDVVHLSVVPSKDRIVVDGLTEREKAVLRLLTTTMSTAEVAQELYLSLNTVKTHLSAIYRKIGVSRRREAVARARELELL